MARAAAQPSATTTVPLRRLVMCADGMRIPLSASERALRPGSIPYWGANGVVDHVDAALFNEELVLLGEDGAPFFDRTKDVAFRTVEPIWPNNHIHVLRPDASAVDARFLTYALNCTDFGSVISGSTRDKLTQDDMKGIRIPRLELGAQRRIADFLDDRVSRIDQIIAARHQQIGLIDEVAKSGMAREALDTEGPRIPLKRLIEDERLGIWGSEPGDEPVDMRVARVADFNRPDFTLGRVETSRSATAAQISGRQLQRGDVLLERSGGTQMNPVGCPAFVESVEGNMVCSNFVSRLRPAEGVDGRYLSLVLGALYASRQQAPHSTQTTGIMNLNTGSYFKVLIPARTPASMVRLGHDLDRALVEARRRQEHLKHSIDLLTEYKSSVITAAVTGELDVTTASRRIPGE